MRGKLAAILREIRIGKEESIHTNAYVEEIKPASRTELQKWDFLWMQFKAQYQHYSPNFQKVQYQIIKQVRQIIGHMIVDRLKNAIPLMDNALLPES